ncbi:MAG: hypothetical protein ACPGWR_22235 [Ardenticatenaceae bacterium]
MNEMNEHERDAYAAVDDALQTYSLAPVPAHLQASIMAQVRSSPQMPPFRLAWLDYALSLFAALMSGVIVGLLQAIPSQLSLNVPPELALLLPATTTPALFSGLILFASLLLAGIALYEEQTKFASC